MGDLFDEYQCGAAWDEMIDAAGLPRPPYQVVYQSMCNSGTAELARAMLADVAPEPASSGPELQRR